MSIYMTEAEQLDVMKKWWQRHQNTVLVALSIALLIVAGVRYWHWNQEKINQQASNTYEHLMIAFSNQDNKQVRSYASDLLTHYGKTVYADAARLTLAKLFVDKSNYKKALAQLNYVASHSKMMALQDVAKIRMSRLLLAEKSYDTALAELTKINDKSYLPAVNELRGDIFAASGQSKKAVAAYKKALDEGKTQGMGNLFLEMKTDALIAQNKTTTLNG